jgi:hypothetical protein
MVLAEPTMFAKITFVGEDMAIVVAADDGTRILLILASSAGAIIGMQIARIQRWSHIRYQHLNCMQ